MTITNKHRQRYRRIVTKINKLEKEMVELRGDDFSAKTALFKMRLKSGESLDELLPSAYALAREAAKRVIGLRAFNVQLQGAVAAHEEKIVEMKTGEGKTLAILFPAYLNALEGKGVHVVTANDYLAERDAKWMGKVYSFLGLSVGSITDKTEEFERQVSYSSDVTYVSNNEVGFDFLKDNMLYDKKNKRQRDLHFAIIDEADSVLIDEAQTPLVISDSILSDEDSKKQFVALNSLIKELRKNIDFEINEKERAVSLEAAGVKKLETLLGVNNLYDSEIDYLYYVECLLKAHLLFKKDRDYVVDKKNVVIVDEFTGRLMPNHRYCQGIHQAIEAKEGLAVQDEDKTLASITFQHLFKHYNKMAGLTGTAATARKEFRLIYRKEVVQIPTDKRIIRDDASDRFFLNWNDKLDYLAWFVQEHYFKKRAALIGTRSIRKSQRTYQVLMGENIPSAVLNAKHTSREAEVIAQAGQPQTVTVATNMAGRGTDIELAQSVRDQIGLVVIGTERHNARRIDSQLVGRAGRQGDPGYSQFFISAEDELIKAHFKKEYITELKRNKGWPEGVGSVRLQAIINKAQKRMEGLFFDQRVLNYEFDHVLEAQRNSFYRQRNRVLRDENLKEETLGLLKKYAYGHVILPQQTRSNEFSRQQVAAISTALKKAVINRWFQPNFEAHSYTIAEMRKGVYDSIIKYYNNVEHYVSEEKMRKIEKTVTLKVLDLLWVEHLRNVESMQEAALISSIGQASFFEEYEIEMARVYKSMLYSAPRIICLTLLRTMNVLLTSNENNNNEYSR